MDYKTFQARSAELLEGIARQEPLAIVQFGSSLREEDYVPGVSDLDAFVISEEPVDPPENDLGYKYYHTRPREFVRRASRGDSFVLCALTSGHARYDPKGFVSSLFSLCDAGFPLGPTSYTLGNIACGIGGQLSDAFNNYLSADPADRHPQKVLARINKTLVSVAMAEIVVRSGSYVSGYNEVRRALERMGSPLLAPLIRSRDNLLNHDRFTAPRQAHTRLTESDRLAAEVLAAESLFVEHAGAYGVTFRRRTNDLIAEYEAEYGPLDRLHAVRIENYSLRHLVLGERDGVWRLFGHRVHGETPIRVVEPVLPKDAPVVMELFRKVPSRKLIQPRRGDAVGVAADPSPQLG